MRIITLIKVVIATKFKVWLEVERKLLRQRTPMRANALMAPEPESGVCANMHQLLADISSHSQFLFLGWDRAHRSEEPYAPRA